MVGIAFENRTIEIASGQTVLAALDAAGIRLDRSCRAGVCQSCLVQAVDGTIPAKAQEGLPRALKAQGYFMACVCIPETSMSIIPADAVRQRTAVSVAAIDQLSDTVLRLRLIPESTFSYRAGQFLNLVTPDGLVRSYSIASLPDSDPFLELHIRLIPDGRMSGYLQTHVAVGDALEIQGPAGSCTYAGIDPDDSLVLAGTGTGLAPLWGVLRDALSQGHRGPIALYHGALTPSGLYLADELRRLQERHGNFSYRPCVRDGGVHGEGGGATGDLIAAVTTAPVDPKAAAYFLCGDPALVRKMKKTLFLNGARLDRLHADPFVAAV